MSLQVSQNPYFYTVVVESFSTDRAIYRGKKRHSQQWKGGKEKEKRPNDTSHQQGPLFNQDRNGFSLSPISYGRFEARVRLHSPFSNCAVVRTSGAK